MMSRLAFVALVIALCGVAAVAAESFEVPAAPLGAHYGVINFEHTAHLNNVKNGHQQLYVLTNFPAPRKEVVVSFAVLYTPLPAGAADTGADVLLSIARPTGTGSNVVLVASGLVHLTQSGVTSVFDGAALGLELQNGDFLVVSVPNNKVELHVGPNQGGNGLTYSIISAAVTTDASAVAAYKNLAAAYVAGPLVGGQVEQVCGTYGTIGNGNNPELSHDTIMFAAGANQIISNTQGPQGHLIKSFAVGLFTLDNTGEAVPLDPTVPVSVDLVIAKLGTGGVNDPDPTKYYIPAPGQEAGRILHVNNVLSSSFPDPPALPLYNPRFLNPADPAERLVIFGLERVGIRVTTPNVYLSYTDSRDDSSPGIGKVDYHLWVPNTTPDAYKLTRIPPVFGQPNFEFDIGVGGGDINGDPQFAGFQGQNFQFHGLADEHFNLISSPSMQLNAHFVYLSSGKCGYNNTVCFQHPGTYVDVLGFSIPSAQGEVLIKVVAGSHEAGLRVWMSAGGVDMREVHLHAHTQGIRWSMSNDTSDVAILRYSTFGEVTVETPLFSVNVINSDFFFNMGMSLKSPQLLKVGSAKHTVTDHKLCDANNIGKHSGEGHSHTYDRAVEDAVAAKYPAAKGLPQVHGLIGQTWRNVKVCSKEWMGNVQDYVVADLFSEDYVFNFYAQ